jgi:hypothetical protein
LELRQKFEQRRFSITVTTNHTNAVTLVHTNGDFIENGFGWELETDGLGTEQVCH